MINCKLILFILVNILSLSVFPQSLANKTIEELETMKKEAISSENYDLANKITEEQKTRVSIDDKIKELDKKLTIAVANENYNEAEKLKKEIKGLEDKKVKLTQLEEEKKAAILVEDFDKVIALDKQITDLKIDRKPEPVTTTTSQPSLQINAPTNSPNPTNNSTAIIFPTELSPNGDGINDFLVFKNLDTYEYNQMTIKTQNHQSLVYMKSNYQNNWAGNKIKNRCLSIHFTC
jgi:hypothetical protein